MKKKNNFELRIINKEEKRVNFNFFVDGIALTQRLNIKRFDLAYCDFDLDFLEVDKCKFPNYDRKKINKVAVSRVERY